MGNPKRAADMLLPSHAPAQSIDTSPLAALDDKTLEALAYKAAAHALSQPKEVRKGGDEGPAAITLTLERMKFLCANPLEVRRILLEHQPGKIKGTAPGLARKTLQMISDAKATAQAESCQQTALPAGDPLPSVAAVPAAPAVPDGNSAAQPEDDMAKLARELDAERLTACRAAAKSPVHGKFHELPENWQYALARQAILEHSARELSSFLYKTSSEKRELVASIAGRMLALHEGGQQYDAEALRGMREYRGALGHFNAELMNRCVDCAHGLSLLMRNGLPGPSIRNVWAAR